jgi:hypothetical protein
VNILLVSKPVLKITREKNREALNTERYTILNKYDLNCKITAFEDTTKLVGKK